MAVGDCAVFKRFGEKVPGQNGDGKECVVLVEKEEEALGGR